MRKPNAADIPRGSYRASCWGCQVVADDDEQVLTCECSMRCGALQRTVYVLDGSCTVFTNRDGELVCDRAMENAAGVPRGPYEDTCGGCAFDAAARRLTCVRCRSAAGALVETALVVPDGCTIVNDGGRLACAAPAAPLDDPMAVADEDNDNGNDNNDEKKEL